ncbi:MAG: hypothetical protein EA367_11155 [Leptolyngbya sp. DLM2.Bin15]|nr:MAG: hypothetical protein EA367_11155 [Leptolyngbya sp. DLM2.Bin15]
MTVIRFYVVAPLVLLGLLMGTACSSPTTSTESVAVESGTPSVPLSDGVPLDQPETLGDDSSTAAPRPAPAASTSSHLISASGIGTAQLGMTLAEFRETLTADQELTPVANVMVDFDAIAVTQAGEIQYYILHLSGAPFTDADVIQGLKTENPAYQTQEGIGVGSAITQAEDIYGDATLAYNLDNEGREYVRFANFPANNILFGTGSYGAQTAGIYADPSGSYNETQAFRGDAVLQSILLVCLSADCSN